ncbi:DUF2058 family protein [Lysobacter panacisoli]|uniref:DUF2058 family protein n=2 Tax=Lysobacter panacisoli TaxID=1255263 RepID=A0ABP9L7M4_9GAMM
MGLGFKPAPKPERPAQPKQGGKPSGKPEHRGAGKPSGRPEQRTGKPHDGKPGQRKPGGPRPGGKPQSREDIDLAKAYAIRAQREKDERIAAEAAKQEEARKRREARAKLAELVKDKALNDPAADIARHFPYGDKIKRIYVNEVQLKALNGGELGVIQMDGRYLLVTAELLAQAEAIFAPAIALKVDPNAPAGDDPYADPQYQVPDDLVW